MVLTVTWHRRCWPRECLTTPALTGSRLAACSTNCSGGTYHTALMSHVLQRMTCAVREKLNTACWGITTKLAVCLWNPNPNPYGMFLVCTLSCMLQSQSFPTAQDQRQDGNWSAYAIDGMLVLLFHYINLNHINWDSIHSQNEHTISPDKSLHLNNVYEWLCCQCCT